MELKIHNQHWVDIDNAASHSVKLMLVDAFQSSKKQANSDYTLVSISYDEALKLYTMISSALSRIALKYISESYLDGVGITAETAIKQHAISISNSSDKSAAKTLIDIKESIRKTIIADLSKEWCVIASYRTTKKMFSVEDWFDEYDSYESTLTGTTPSLEKKGWFDPFEL